jgi:hypothetical protein
MPLLRVNTGTSKSWVTIFPRAGERGNAAKHGSGSARTAPSRCAPARWLRVRWAPFKCQIQHQHRRQKPCDCFPVCFKQSWSRPALLFEFVRDHRNQSRSSEIQDHFSLKTPWTKNRPRPASLLKMFVCSEHRLNRPWQCYDGRYVSSSEGECAMPTKGKKMQANHRPVSKGPPMRNERPPKKQAESRVVGSVARSHRLKLSGLPNCRHAEQALPEIFGSLLRPRGRMFCLAVGG